VVLEMLGPGTPGTFTPRVPSKGWLGDRIEGFVHMQQLRADFVEAVIACVTGHRMTPELAALCIATYWRRYAAIANYQESRGAAITLQAAFRGMDNRLVLKDQSDAAAKLQAVLKGRKTREKTDDELSMYRAVSRLQAVWRGHLARSYSDKLRWQSKSKLQRTFSWGKKGSGKKGSRLKRSATSDAIRERSAKDILAGAGVDDPKPTNVIRRSSANAGTLTCEPRCAII
jgi:hypothetical protein